MSIVTTVYKEQHWNELTDKLAHTTDKLGKGIDEGIFETVVVCNALDMPTRASCEGHLEWGVGAPWIDIVSLHPATQVSIALLMDELIRDQKQGIKTQVEIAAQSDEVHRRRIEIKKQHIQVRQRLLGYLARFYQERNVPYEERLIVRPLSTDGKSRLESQGADCQDALPLVIRQKKLTAYQAEMHAFTNFLKTIYFTEI